MPVAEPPAMASPPVMDVVPPPASAEPLAEPPTAEPDAEPAKAETKKVEKPPKQPEADKPPRDAVRTAIYATVVIVLALSVMATFAYIKTK